MLQDLLRFDTQSHGHYHVVYRDPGANRRNLGRAHRVLAESGFEPVGFAAPHGRWNAGLDAAMEELGYLYSSDFQLGYDDFPFFPWRGDRFSTVLQVPIHPVCEGLFLEAGIDQGRAIADYLVRVVRARVDAGEPAFVYGHPERRLARFPQVLAALDASISRRRAPLEGHADRVRPLVALARRAALVAGAEAARGATRSSSTTGTPPSRSAWRSCAAGTSRRSP